MQCEIRPVSDSQHPHLFLTHPVLGQVVQRLPQIGRLIFAVGNDLSGRLSVAGKIDQENAAASLCQHEGPQTHEFFLAVVVVKQDDGSSFLDHSGRTAALRNNFGLPIQLGSWSGVSV